MAQKDDEKASRRSSPKFREDIDAPDDGGGEGSTLVGVAQDVYNANREDLARVADLVRSRARREPVRTLLMTAGAGVVLGVLFG